MTALHTHPETAADTATTTTADGADGCSDNTDDARFSGLAHDRADQLFHEHSTAIASHTDRMFGVLLIGQWLAGIVVAIWVTPYTWIGAQSEVHLHVFAAIFLGGAIVSLPATLAYVNPGAVSTRHIVAVGQMLFGALLIHLMGGRIETHFHVFGSLAVLAFYRDWRVLMTASVVVVLDHMIRGLYWPQSAFGVLAAGSWRWLEHAGWVVFMNIFLVGSCLRSKKEMRSIARRQAEVESTNDRIESTVVRRTAELEHAKLEAERAARVKSEFLANMSHEIRTPMTAILGYADVLSQDKLDEQQQREHIETIRRNGEHLLSILNDILDLSKMDSERMQAELMSVQPCQLITEVVELMGVRAAEKGLTVEVDRAFPLPERIESDGQRVRQILMNLLGNAIKFTDEGVVQLNVSFHEDDEQIGSCMRFDVIDTGIGMTGDQMQQLFQPFSQVDTSAKRRFGGTGLGLTISKRFAEMLGGRLEVSSEIDKGSTFTLVIPTGDLTGVGMLNQLDKESCSELTSHSKPEAMTSLRGRVLLAEDGPDNQRLIQFVLRKAGLDVQLASNGREAVEMVMAARQAGKVFDVILMDMQMPELDGYEAVGELRRGGCDWPIIALTAHSMSGDREKCLEAGCCDYMSKPIDRKALLHAIASQLGNAASNAA